MDIINYTDLRTNLKHWMNKVSDDMIGLVIKRKKDNDLVLIPLSEYNSLKETAYLMTGKNRDVLLKSIKQLESADIVEGELID
ncbi:MAG: type II toxin-antitoxin system prevent-host-death family antitoxin [Flavobacteriaceae bacterium]|nr:type II toxin-antitoxin system prevent-host-death family antitoxin [Flavobacteriaceae bacterium]